MPANDYVDTYLRLWAYLKDDTYHGSVRNYLQNGDNQQSARAQVAYGHLMRALPKLVGKPLGNVFTVEDDQYVTSSLNRVFLGKGAPNEIQDAIYLAFLCGLVNQGSLTAYLDQNVGVDCGGFVANYWGMGRPDLTTPAPTGSTGFLPRNFWSMAPQLRRKNPGEIKVDDAAIFFQDVKSDDPNIAAHKNANGKGYDTSTGSQAHHIAVVTEVVAVAGVSQITLTIAESSGAKRPEGFNGVNVRSFGQVKATVAKNLVYCMSGTDRVYFVGPPSPPSPYQPIAYGL